jgi:tRNA/rRNA methyltransferase
MNLGQAVAVCLYELVREDKDVLPADTPQLATAEKIERLTGLLFQSLQASGYVKPRTASSTEKKLMHLVHRLQLPADDADIWMGMLRKIVWKLRQP